MLNTKLATFTRINDYHNKPVMYRLAIDFDGTIVENRYPKIGKPIPFAFETLKALRSKGCMLILWTCREGKVLNEAVEFCRENGVEFYAINKNYPEEDTHDMSSRKIDADYYIDDRGLPAFLGWGETFQLLFPDDNVVTKRKRFNISFFNDK